MFRQVHQPGDLAASDFTSMNALSVHHHGPAVRSHGLSLRVDLLELGIGDGVRFGARSKLLSDGLQNVLWELGGAPGGIAANSSSAAVNNLSATREFQTRYRDLLSHYGLSGQRINVRNRRTRTATPSSCIGHFKTAVEQGLLLRGSRDFASREEYADFLKQLVLTRNAGRQNRFTEERQALRDLPDDRLSSCLKVRCRVNAGSLIHIHRNAYSVHSRLIGEEVEAQLFADRVEVWYADRHVDTLPRLVGRDQHAVHYRHVIDSAGAQAGRSSPTTPIATTCSRRRGSASLTTGSAKAATNAAAPRAYCKILHHAAHTSEVAVDDALRVLLAK